MTAAERLQAEKERLLAATGFYVPPYRMANLMKAAAKIMDIIAPSRGVDTGFEGVLWGDIPVRKYNKIKGRSRKRPQPAHKAPQCRAFQGNANRSRFGGFKK